MMIDPGQVCSEAGEPAKDGMPMKSESWRQEANCRPRGYAASADWYDNAGRLEKVARR